MKKTIKFGLIFLLITYASGLIASQDFKKADKNYFQFAITHYHTNRQAGQIVNIYIRYAYKDDLVEAEYPDYRLLRADSLKYMEPSDKFPENVFWEILAAEMGKELMKNYPLAGISVQLEVLDNQDPNSYEPSNHGPIYTKGDIEPLNVIS